MGRVCIKENDLTKGRKAPPTPTPKGQTKYDIELEYKGLSEYEYMELMEIIHYYKEKKYSSIKIYVNN